MDPFYEAPTIYAEWAPGATPRTASPTWVALPRLVSVSIAGGRQEELGTMDPTTATLVLGGHPQIDASLDPLDPEGATVVDGLPWTPIRVSATYKGTTTRIFTGYIDGDAFTPVGAERGVDQPVQITATDWRGWAAQVALPPSVWEIVAMDYEPLVFIGGEQSMGAGGPGLYDDGELGWAPLVVSSGSSSVLEKDPIIPGSSTPSMWFGSTGPHTFIQQDVDMDPATAPAVSIALWIDTEPTLTKRYIVMMRTPGVGTPHAALGLDADGRPFAELRNLSGTVLATAKTTGSIIADQADGPVLLIASWSRAKKEVTVAVVDPEGGGIWGTTNIATATTGAAASSIAIGAPLLRVQDASSAPAAFYGGIAVWPYEWSAELTRWRHLDDGLGIASVVGRLVGSVGAANVPRSIPSPTRKVVGIAQGGGSLGAAIDAYGEALAGATFVQRNGTLTIVGLDDLDSPTYGTPFAEIGDDPASTWAIRPTTRGRTGRRMARVLNRAEVTFGPLWTEGYPSKVRARSRSSIQRYGRREFAPPWRIYERADAEWLPQLIIDRYARPRIELGEITLEPLGDDRATSFVLSANSGLLRTVHYVEMARGSTTERRIDGPMRIQGFAFDWADGRHWTVTYRLAPDGPDMSYPDPAP